jgi:hypothetical protein
MKTVVAAGGRAETICNMPNGYGRGGAWNASNVIVFAWETGRPLYRVSANGGEATPVTTIDARALRVTGEAVSLGDRPTSNLGSTSFSAGPSTSVSPSGSLAYFSSPPTYTNTTATWIEPTGKTASTVKVPPGQYSGLRISPDGTHAVFVRSNSMTDASLWLVDLARGGAVPLSSGRGWNDSPVWSPNSTRVVFASDRDGPQEVFVKNVADASPEQPLYRSPVLFKNPDAWSSDDRWIVFSAFEPNTGLNLFLLPDPSSGAPVLPVPYLRGPRRDSLGVPSPDRRWLAYVSNETGREELYVQSFPEPGQKKQISTDGVSARWWSRGPASMLASAFRPSWRARPGGSRSIRPRPATGLSRPSRTPAPGSP